MSVLIHPNDNGGATELAPSVGRDRFNAMRLVTLPATSNRNCETFRSNYVGATRKSRCAYLSKLGPRSRAAVINGENKPQ